MSVKSALALYNECKNRKRSISFGCDVLDQHIGPIMTQGITEVAGEAGCGKTQLCMVMALQTLIQSNMEGSIAIMSCGEGAYPIKRLSDLAKEYESLYPPYTAPEMLQHVQIVECRNQEHAVDSINKRVPEMCRSQNVRLLIIDSMAGLVRFEYDITQEAQMRDRTAFLFNFARQLKWISDIYNVAILVVNQVTATGFDDPNREDSIPALGLVWSTCVTTRLILSKAKAIRYASLAIGYSDIENDNNTDVCEATTVNTETLKVGSSSSNSKVTRRTIRVEFSPYCAPRAIDFEIRKDGIKGIA